MVNYKWELISENLSDGAEVLRLRAPNGTTFCEYAPGVAPYDNTWLAYYFGYPKQEFSSREGCINNARKISRDPALMVKSIKNGGSID